MFLLDLALGLAIAAAAVSLVKRWARGFLAGAGR